MVISVISVYKVSERRGFLMILPLAFAFGSLLLFLLVTGKISEQVYIALSGLGFFLTLLQTSKKIRKIDNELWYKINTSLVFMVIFLWFAGLYGLYLTMPHLSLGYLMLVSLLIITILYYYMIKINDLKVIPTVYVLLFGIINLEILWALSFTHFGHLTIGAILLLVNYTFWDILENYVKGSFTKKLLVVNVLFFILIITGLLATTKWLPG